MPSANAMRLPMPAAKLLRSAVHQRLGRIADGCLHVVEDGSRSSFGPGGDLEATIRVDDPAFYSLVALGGSVGAAESYIAGHWSADSLTDLVRLLVRNRSALEGIESGLARVARPFLKAWHLARRNTPAGSRRNIAAHYDLGNDFYALWLDPTMTYSCGLFPREDSTLEEASLAKYDRLCRKLALKPSDHVLEIGTGWGGFALHAARHYGCRVATTTISREQYAYAQRRVADAGLSDRIELHLRDYRELEGQYDKLVSIEMIEAVGWQFYGTFMATCSRLLAPGGTMAMQAITIRDDMYESARDSVDFIQRFIFPGSCIPSLTALASAAASSSDLRLVQMEDIGPHYARTLREWRDAFMRRLPEVRELGFDDRFIRLWEFYLSYCEGGFAERHIGCSQLIWARPGWHGEPILMDER